MAKIRIDRAPGNLPKVTTYNGTATAGNGLGALVGYGSLMANSTNGATVVTFTVGAANGLFEIGGFYVVTAWTSGNVSVNVSYTDCRGNAQSGLTLFGRRSTDATHALNIAAVGELNLDTVSLCAQSGTTVTIKTSFGGTATADFYGFIRQVN